MLSKKVSQVMTKDVITVDPETDVVFAFEKLMKEKISAMPVVDESGEMLGIITATDLGHNLILDKYKLGTQVKEIMVKNVICVSPDESLIDTIKLMNDNGLDDGIVNQLPVIDNGKLVGIISDGDIIKDIC